MSALDYLDGQPGEWFIVGDEPRMAGWSAATVPGAGECPRCRAVVGFETNPGRGWPIGGHERWHARTDHPVPAVLLEQAAPEYRSSYAYTGVLMDGVHIERQPASHPVSPADGSTIHDHLYRRVFRSVPLYRDYPLHGLCGTCAQPITRISAGHVWQHDPEVQP